MAVSREGTNRASRNPTYPPGRIPKVGAKHKNLSFERKTKLNYLHRQIGGVKIGTKKSFGECTQPYGRSRILPHPVRFCEFCAP